MAVGSDVTETAGESTGRVEQPVAEAEEGSESPFIVGNPVDEVKIDIDYAIIKHFSEHLYSSPNKAIEELVSNSFDALATRCYVYVPGELVDRRVLVWDNGLSMDPAGLQAMWQIARSPKEDFGRERINSAEGRRRAMIGKFGIGKLASYAVGHRISHLCCTADGRYLSVSVNYRLFTDHEGNPDPLKAIGEMPTRAPGIEGGSQAKSNRAGDPSKAPIRELTSDQARELIKALLPNGDAFEAMWSQPHWTLAVIDDLKPVTLYPGRLRWVLGNGMPLRPDFEVYVDDCEVTPRLATKAESTWNLGEKRLRDQIASTWNDFLRPAVGEKQVQGIVDFEPSEPDRAICDDADPVIDEPAINFPTLGRVTATVRVFESSLSQYREDEGRSYGFFLTVRGRLVNPDDEKLLLNDPSYGTFYRSQFQIRADGLDADLLADRESLRRDTRMTRELRVLQIALYRAARAEVEKNDEVKSKAERPESRLPTRSRELFRDPVVALMAKSSSNVPLELDEPVVDREELGDDRPIAELSSDSGHFVVNRSHPFYKTIESQAGSGKKAAATMRAVDLFAVSERLTEGFLYNRGIPDDQVEDIFLWRDKLFRSLAATYGRNPDDAVLEVRAASVPGGKRFEVALAQLFVLMGFAATQHGESGKKDVLVVAPLGPDHRVFIVEAKGSKDPVQNVTAALAGAAAHRDEVDGAVHALVVAREFAGFKMKDEPAILKECQAVQGVSVVHVETLVKLYHALMKYAYPLTSVMDALFAIETPAEKDARVEALERPLEEFNYLEVLEEIWERQSGESVEDQVPIRALWQGNPMWRKGMAFPEFKDKLAALEHFASRLMVLDSQQQTVYIRQCPERVAEHVRRCLAPLDSSVGHPLLPVAPEDAAE